MRSIEKRIREIENRLTRKDSEGAWLAFIEKDESVKLSHIKHGSKTLNGRKELQDFISSQNLKGFDLIIIDHAQCQGKPPGEL